MRWLFSMAIAAGVLLCASVAFAQANKVLSVASVMTGCDGVSINAPVTCGPTFTEGANGVSLIIKYVNGAGTGWGCDLETFDSLMGEWALKTTQKITSGVAELSPRKLLRTVSADEVVEYVLVVNDGSQLRLTNCLATGTPNASDTLKVVLRRTFSPDL